MSRSRFSTRSSGCRTCISKTPRCAILPLAEAEDRWLRDCWGPSHRETNPVLGRLDAVVEFTSPMWKDSLKFMEPNLCGVGGIHLGPACDQMLAEVVLPMLVETDPLVQMELGLDFREVLLQEILDHLQTIGRSGQNLCFVEPKYEFQGPEEQETLADYYRQRHGLHVMHADPSELSLVDGEVTYEGCRIDIAYRDYEVRDLLRLAEEGVDIEPLKRLFQDNRVVSSLAGDFDHKSCWELLTDFRFTQKYFTAEERQIFRRHVLWTRILSDRETSLPDGREPGDLLRFVRRQHEVLVLKPNRSYGGDRIVIGHGLPQADWERAVEAALADPEPWVVQRLASLPVTEFPIVGADGRVAIEPFYTVLGFAPSRYGLSIMGRASQKQVVNVAQRGGMCGVLIGRYQGRLFGPGMLGRPLTAG